MACSSVKFAFTFFIWRTTSCWLFTVTYTNIYSLLTSRLAPHLAVRDYLSTSARVRVVQSVCAVGRSFDFQRIVGQKICFSSEFLNRLWGPHSRLVVVKNEWNYTSTPTYALMTCSERVFRYCGYRLHLVTLLSPPSALREGARNPRNEVLHFPKVKFF